MSKEELLEVIEMIENDELEDVHLILKHDDSPEVAWLMAFVYRKEGDKWNANYWYDKAGRTMPSSSLNAELEEIKELIEGL